MKLDSAAVAQTTPTGKAIAHAVARSYALGDIKDCALLRRGFNHVYGLRLGNGRRAVARLSADRPRGAPNIEYEAALLAHLKKSGAAVAASLPTREGAPAASMALPEGERALMLFEYLDGDPPGEALRDIEATGRGLALLHEAGRSYQGPASRYLLELPGLLGASLERLCGAPMVDERLRADFTAIAQRLHDRISAMKGLSRVACHGDCHGSNNFMTDGHGETRLASFFDFDDSGPGYLAYEMCVYLWSLLPRNDVAGELNAAQRERWQRYLTGYRSVGALSASDLDAIAPFAAVRQFWVMGEHAGRTAVWGTEAMPTSWLRKQVKLLTAWESMTTPD
jgi:Ser/Thr protein kinase RdoA (MazF antagonist)